MALTSPIFELKQKGYVLSTDPARLDLGLIHRYLSEESYWARGIPCEVVRRSIENSICFGIYQESQQVAFSRVISDLATYAWIGDVFVLPAQRKQGLGKWLVEAMLQHPDLQGLRRWTLATGDAHDLYARYGFRPIEQPGRLMELHPPNIYAQ